MKGKHALTVEGHIKAQPTFSRSTTASCTEIEDKVALRIQARGYAVLGLKHLHLDRRKEERGEG